MASRQSLTRIPAACSRRALRACIDEYILDHRSQNHSPKTIEWHMLALGYLSAFLAAHDVLYLGQLERVHVLSWLDALRTQPGAKGKVLAARSVNCDARSMRAFCNWLEAAHSEYHRILRHSFAFRYLQTGGDPHGLQVLLGYEGMAPVRQYLRWYDQLVHDRLEKKAQSTWSTRGWDSVRYL